MTTNLQPTIIDLTQTLSHGMRGVEIHPHTWIASDGYNTTNLHLYSHAGTDTGRALALSMTARPLTSCSPSASARRW